MWVCTCDLVTGKILCKFVEVVYFVLSDRGRGVYMSIIFEGIRVINGRHEGCV
jgi:hypothetical protein